MAKITPVKSVVELCGGNVAIAKRIGISSQAVSRWLMKGFVPIERVPVVSELSGLPRHVIRPDRPDLFPPPSAR